MAYNKHVWKDEVVQFPNRYKLKDVATGNVVATYNLERETGEVVSQDPVNASKLNNIESAVFDSSVVLENLSTAISDTGTVNSLNVDSSGTFDLTKNNNVTPYIIPLFTNTNTVVIINFDGQGGKLIRKANDVGNFVALDIGDIKKNVPIQLVWDTVNNFFIFAPRGGNNIKSIQRGVGGLVNTNTGLNVTVTTVDKSKCLLLFEHRSTVSGQTNANTMSISGKITNDTTLTFNRQAGYTGTHDIYWTLIEFNNVKSRQEGLRTNSTTSDNVTITSVNTSKSIAISNRQVTGGTTPYAMTGACNLANSTTLTILSPATVINSLHEWQVIEFN